MFKFIHRIFLILAVAYVSVDSTAAQVVSEPQDVPAEWTKPFPPFRIAGNLYYVGTYDLACFLIKTTRGLILINTGLASSDFLIRQNIEALGFKYNDLKILLTTQAHYDHMGAMAAIKNQTGAKMMVNSADADVMTDGGKSDYALGGAVMYQPLLTDRLLKNCDTIELGEAKIVMLHHPGHTKGSSSFLFDVTDERKTYRVLVANMPTIVTNKAFSEIPDYPEIAEDYASTLERMKNLSFDIWLASHASQFALHSKYKPGDAYNPTVFIDRKAYDAALNSLTTEFSRKQRGK